MILTGGTFPNPDFGYETTIRLPFYFSKLGNGKISVYDESYIYDTYSVKCSCVMGYRKMAEFSDTYVNSSRGYVLSLYDTFADGFYPFTPAIPPPRGLDDRYCYAVTLNNISMKGQLDNLAKGFRVDFDMLMSYDNIDFAPVAEAASEGSFVFDSDSGVTISGIRFPVNRFSPAIGYNVYSRQMLGGVTETIDYSYFADREPKSTNMTITANTRAASNIIRALVFNIRSNPFTIYAPMNYHVFGMGTGEFKVRLNGPEIKVRHTRFDEFEIVLNVAEAADTNGGLTGIDGIEELGYALEDIYEGCSLSNDIHETGAPNV